MNAWEIKKDLMLAIKNKSGYQGLSCIMEFFFLGPNSYVISFEILGPLIFSGKMLMVLASLYL